MLAEASQEGLAEGRSEDQGDSEEERKGQAAGFVFAWCHFPAAVDIA